MLAAMLFGATMAASGADLQWAPYGDLPGNVPSFSLAPDPTSANAAYAATLGSGLLHTDDGKSWSEVGAGSLPRRQWRVAIDPARGPGGGPPPIYVGAAGDGFYKSLDAGKSWQQLNNGLGSAGSRNVRSIALGRGIIVIGTSDGVYKTTDGGGKWDPMSLQGLDISAVAFAQYGDLKDQANNPVVVLAGIDGVRDAGSRLVRTVDLGANWIPLKTGVPPDLVVAAIAAGPVPQGQNLRPLFVAGSAGVIKSDDGGDSWSPLSALPPQAFSQLALSAFDANIVYASSDGGGPAGGVWRSTDRGASWTPMSSGLAEKGITALGLARTAPATLVALAYNPDKPLATAYVLSDTQAVPAGTAEGGTCPEPGTLDQCPTTNVANPGELPSPFQVVSACASPTPSPAATPTAAPASPEPAASAPATASASAAPSPSPSPSTNPAFGCESPSPSPGGGG
ncbi:MAG: hypothetical protein QOE92_2641, partial [Chloroflexota bacterium]|nr:hypothetical protein [Chloroflexota bacterium]